MTGKVEDIRNLKDIVNNMRNALDTVQEIACDIQNKSTYTSVLVQKYLEPITDNSGSNRSDEELNLSISEEQYFIFLRTLGVEGIFLIYYLIKRKENNLSMGINTFVLKLYSQYNDDEKSNMLSFFAGNVILLLSLGIFKSEIINNSYEESIIYSIDSNLMNAIYNILDVHKDTYVDINNKRDTLSSFKKYIDELFFNC